MRIGILTWFDVLNYGSVFQAYALQECVKSMGNTVEILRHDRVLPKYYANELGSISFVNIVKWLRNQSPGRVRYRTTTKKKYAAFESFRDEYLNIGSHYSNAHDDAVLIGSDQVFDINGFYYPFQFGQGIDSKSISTYAPSFGETTAETLEESGHYSEIISNIKSLIYVNARDENTERILSDIRKEKIDVVIDPVLLYSFSKEKTIWNKRLIKGKYCIVYTWGGYTTEKDFSESCVRFAKANNLKLVSVGEYRPWCDMQFASASPIEFFELYMYADMVLTNMFHGTCFSIIMQKPFYSFVMPHNENKLGDLLKQLKVESQMLRAPGELGSGIPVINYEQVVQVLKEKKDYSYKCLERAIGSRD